MEKSQKYEYDCNMTFKHETPRTWYELIFGTCFILGIAFLIYLTLYRLLPGSDNTSFNKYLNLAGICLIPTIIGEIGGIISTRIRIRYDFHYTVVLKENSFSIKGGADTPYRAWYRNSTYAFDESKKQVTISDDIGNQMTYLYDEHFKEFLEEIHMN